MVTVLRASGLSVVIFLDDHEPAHVHVFGDGEAKIELIGQNQTPWLVWAGIAAGVATVASALYLRFARR